MNMWEKKVPGLLGILLILVGIAGTSFLVQTGVKLFSSAAPSDQPHDYQVTNVTDTSFTVLYRTDAQVIGTITLTDDAGATKVIVDDRDQATGKPQPYQIHSITIRGLKPTTTYSFSITSGTDTFLYNNKPFQATTGAPISASPENQPAVSGTIQLDDGSKPQEALVVLSTPQGQILSTLAKPNGTYELPLNTIRTNDFSAYLPLDGSANLQLLFLGPTLVSQVLTQFNSGVLPAITLGSNYDFTESQNPIASSEASAFSAKFPQFTTNVDTSITVQITTPKQNASYTDAQPDFTGTAAPNSSVQIQIHSTQAITTTVTADALGNWSYRPVQPLAPGQHTITIIAKDASGIIKQVTNSFTVYASGTQVGQSATPSATLTPPTATPIPTQTQTVSPTLVPTLSVAPSNTPVTPTIAPTLIPVISSNQTLPTKAPNLPSTGPENTLLFGFLGVGTIITGSLLFLFSVL